MSDDDQRWVDEVVFYRNLAIMHGAGPNEMTNDWDRHIAEAGISMEPSDDPHRDYESADARREVMDIWETNERLEAEIKQLQREKDDVVEELGDAERQVAKLRDILDSPLGRATFPQALEGTGDE